MAHSKYKNILYDGMLSWRVKKEKAKTQESISRVMAFIIILHQEKRQAREKGANPLPVSIKSNANFIKKSSESKKILSPIDK